MLKRQQSHLEVRPESLGPNEPGIRVICRVHPMAQLLRACKIAVSISGMGPSFRGGWGERAYKCDYGPHEIEVSIRYMTEQIGHASTVVTVTPDQRVTVNYRSPSMFFLFLTSRRGSISVDLHPFP